MYLSQGKSSEVLSYSVGGGSRFYSSCYQIVFDLYYSLLCEIEKCPELSFQFLENTLFSLLFALDFVGVAETGLALQTLIDIVHNHSKL